jgi:hypothetical protein
VALPQARVPQINGVTVALDLDKFEEVMKAMG